MKNIHLFAGYLRRTVRKIKPVNHTITKSDDTLLQYPVVINSIPKCGTHLVKNMILAIPGSKKVSPMVVTAEIYDLNDAFNVIRQRLTQAQPGQVYAGHIPHSSDIAAWLSQNSIKCLFLYRDPRDYTVSLHHFIMRDNLKKGRRRHKYYDMLDQQGNDHDRLMATICGIGQGQTEFRLSEVSLANVQLMYDAFLPWRAEKDVFSLRYEDLIGEHVGLPNSQAVLTVTSMLQYLGIANVETKPSLVNTILTQGMDPDQSRTFRRGGSGGWKEEYTEQHIQAFCSVTGDLLSRLGYSWD